VPDTLCHEATSPCQAAVLMRHPNRSLKSTDCLKDCFTANKTVSGVPRTIIDFARGFTNDAPQLHRSALAPDLVP
jgi:hypothetical protein